MPEYTSLEKIRLQKLEELRAEGIEPYWTIHHGGTLSAYYRDPDGNQVELQIDAMSPEAIDEFVRSGAFAANPIGIDVSFDDLIARRASGESAESLLAYPAQTDA